MGVNKNVLKFDEVADGSQNRVGQPERYVRDGIEFVRVELDGRVLLVSPTCPHRGSPMTEARVDGSFLVCARHGATFDLRTGGWVRGPKCGNITVTVLDEGKAP